MIKNCEWCNKIFLAESRKKRFCSKSHAVMHYSHKYERVCFQCKQKFVGTKTQTYCSQSCSAISAAKDRQPTFKCGIKQHARELAQSYIRTGRIKRAEVCNLCKEKSENIEAHHEDYNKPLDIKWLCMACHRKLHAKNIFIRKGISA